MRRREKSCLAGQIEGHLCNQHPTWKIAIEAKRAVEKSYNVHCPKIISREDKFNM
jgi:hypothetical protein